MIPGSTYPSETIPDYNDMPLTKKLQLVIEESMRKPKNIPGQQSHSTMLKYDLTVGQQSGKRGQYLEQVYKMLLTISRRYIYATN